MKYFIYQTRKNDCGLASIKIILANLSRDKKFLYIPLGEEYDKQYSLFELKEIAKQYNLYLTGYSVKNIEELKNENRYFILVRKLANGSNHSVVIKKISKNFSIIFDPEFGKKIIYSKKYYKNMCDCEVLIAENSQINNCQSIISSLLNNKEKIKIYSLEIIAILAFIISAYFIDKESHFIYPLSIMVIAVLLLVIYKINIFNIMKKLDENYIGYTYNESPIKREENYRLYHKVKSSVLLTNTNLIINLSSSIGLNLILIIQNSYSIFVLLSNLIIIFFDQLFFDNKIKKNNSELEHEESRLFEDDLKIDAYKEAYENIKIKTYKLAKFMSIKKIIYMFILLMISLLMSAITNNANINFVLFYLAMSIFTFTSFDNAISIINKNKENIINETKFYYLINKNNKDLEKSGK